MGTVKLGIKLVGTHAIISILEFFLLVPLTGLWENNQLYHNKRIKANIIIRHEHPNFLFMRNENQVILF
jgi:hypothetical protein